MTPLTHHEMLALAAPFARSGRQTDLETTDRARRQLRTRPRQVEFEPGLHATEVLLLEPFGSDRLRLTRTLDHPAGLQASVRAVGPSADSLLRDIDAIDPASQFLRVDGAVIALNERLDGAQRVLIEARARVATLELALAVPAVSGVAAELTLARPARTALELPQDLFAVLGWPWARLVPGARGWTSRVKIARREPRRSADALAKVQRMVDHLQRTLGAPPADYHRRHRAARWGVVLRRGIPVLTLVLLALGLWGVSRLAVGRETGAWVLLIHVPTLMLAISFRLQELAQFEIPPLPRPLPPTAWPA